MLAPLLALSVLAHGAAHLAGGVDLRRQNSMTFKNKVIAGFGIALAILILVGVLSYRTMVQNDEDRQWVTHTHQVLAQVDLLLTDLLNAETCERGFILTG